MFYIEEDNKIVLFDEDRQKLEETLLFTPQYVGLGIKETDRPIVNFEFADTPEYLAKEIIKAKENKIQVNDKLRDEAINDGVMYKNILFDSDTDQKVNLLAVVNTMPDDDVVTWFGKDNQPLDCTKEDLLNIGGLITQLHSFCWNKNAQIKYLIDVAETLEELEEINIDYTLIN